MTLKQMLVPTYVHMLVALDGWLIKAESQLDADTLATLMQARLTADMFPLFTQVCFVCVQAQEGVLRLRQEEFPESVAALRNKGLEPCSAEWTVAGARAIIAETLKIIETNAEDMADLSPDTPIAHALPMGMIFDFTAEQYVRDWALPQFYFHVMAAYAILRAQRVPLGKADYVAHLFAYLRPGTMPMQA